MNRYRHCAAATRLSNFAERNAGRGVFVRQVASMRNRCEVEPGKHRITDQVGLRMALDVISLPYPVEFDRRLPHELIDLRSELIMSQANGAILASHSASSIDQFIPPDGAPNNTRLEVLN